MENKKKLQHYAVTDINEIQFSLSGYTDREAEKAVLKYGKNELKNKNMIPYFTD